MGPDAAERGHVMRGQAHPRGAAACFLRVLGISLANALFGDVDGDAHRHVANLAFIIHDDAPPGHAVIWPIHTTIAGMGGAIPHSTVAGLVVVE